LPAGPRRHHACAIESALAWLPASLVKHPCISSFAVRELLLKKSTEGATHRQTGRPSGFLGEGDGEATYFRRSQPKRWAARWRIQPLRRCVHTTSSLGAVRDPLGRLKAQEWGFEGSQRNYDARIRGTRDQGDDKFVAILGAAAAIRDRWVG
jgi:hypothetical protein